MFRSTATASTQIGPVQTDWTIQQLLDWIASEDARAHDERLRPMLSALVAGIAPDAASGLIPRSPVGIVRALGAFVRANPTLRGVPLGTVSGVAAALEASPAVPRMPERGAAAGPAASLRVPLPRLG